METSHFVLSQASSYSLWMMKQERFGNKALLLATRKAMA